ncbi:MULTISPECIES: NADH-quinone oxidoreductase subunit M [Maricaulis]|uniref:NADH dehydrogenase subunit M n=1 Tax=Maricaulis maris (strain MCS10) TaxID=394221 RepID=Q0APX8_MARMM|nr:MULTISPECIES: NADH-quinone oxidoreductase subunit M [Maricaulis]ABI65659.1 NADH dehydrogenase subunit M [Maricaulis maris MCS10]MAC90617.1 NADH-quinone oxidoreductase subunit M [Maricaulis sp.]
MFGEFEAFLSILTFVPALGALVIAIFRFTARSEDQSLIDRNSRWVAWLATMVTLGMSVLLLANFDAEATGFQFVHEVTWLEQIGLGYRMGVDGLSILFVVLTAFLMPICIMASGAIKTRVADYMIAFLLLETMVIGVFCALDLVLFYIFFEGGLIPMFIIIGVWGGQNRVYAAFKFFLYTLLGSVLMLVAMIVMFLQAGTTDVTVLLETEFARNAQMWMWLAFFASFAVKMPMWPVHTWLPDAHVQAPTAGSVILAGVLLKLGGYGFLRFSLPMFPEASDYFAPMVFVLSIIAIIYTSLVAFRQTDIKKLIAYSSVAHMGFVTMGLFAMNETGVQGAIFQMISHGVISGALFLCVGVIYDRMHTREIAFYGGLVHRMPVFAAIFGLFAMANVGLPGTSGFVGEIMTMVGAFQVSWWIATGAAVGVILSAMYMLTVYRDVVFGEITNPKLETITDLNRMEWLIFIPLIIGTLLLGVFSTLITDVTATAVDHLLSNYDAALAASAQ